VKGSHAELVAALPHSVAYQVVIGFTSRTDALFINFADGHRFRKDLQITQKVRWEVQQYNRLAAGRPNLIANRGATLPQHKARRGATPAQHDEMREETKKLAAEAQQSPADPSSAGSRLAEITRLHEAGLLTDEEYQAKRAEIIRQLLGKAQQERRVLGSPACGRNLPPVRAARSVRRLALL